MDLNHSTITGIASNPCSQNNVGAIETLIFGESDDGYAELINLYLNRLLYSLSCSDMLLACTMDPPGELMEIKRAVGRYGQEFCKPRETASALTIVIITVFDQFCLEFEYAKLD